MTLFIKDLAQKELVLALFSKQELSSIFMNLSNSKGKKNKKQKQHK